MLYFSLVTFGSYMYVFPGKVDKYAIQDFKPVVDYVKTFTQKEDVKIYYQHCYMIDEEPDRDMTDDECAALFDTFDELNDAGWLVVTAQGYMTCKGLLPAPFEDYYELEGEVRETYLKSKALVAEEDRLAREELRGDGYSEEQIDNMMNYAIYVDPEEDDDDEDGEDDDEDEGNE